MASIGNSEVIEVLTVKEIGDIASAESGSLDDSDTNDIKCDYRIPIKVAGTTYYIALYDTTA